MIYDVVIIGAGIVGLATGRQILINKPKLKVLIIEKESGVAYHQTGRNSGVIHSGIYYKPGNAKAAMAKAGNKSLKEYCELKDIPFKNIGKFIIAHTPLEIDGLKSLQKRAEVNKINHCWMAQSEINEIEPNVTASAALNLPDTAIVDYKLVSESILKDILEMGGEIYFGETLLSVENDKVIKTNNRDIKYKFAINCAGLYSDKVALKFIEKIDVKIIPFRGEYFQLKSKKSNLIQSMIYPVPNPDFPFLGVHFTPMMDGSIHVGPNAVLALAREGYRWNEINPIELIETLTYSGTLKLAQKYIKVGIEEVVRSLSKKLFHKTVQRMIPSITIDDLIPSKAGVRAQALLPNGELVDDFKFVFGKNSLHVLNAPSPAATASLEIARFIGEKIKSIQL
jgi:(S)-2-hydroxyglutarate dehydrogenase